MDFSLAASSQRFWHRNTGLNRRATLGKDQRMGSFRNRPVETRLRGSMSEASGRFLSPSTVKPRRINFPIARRLPMFRFGIWWMKAAAEELNHLIISNSLGH